LYHEFVHALGFRRHDCTFRTFERMWDRVDPEARTVTQIKFANFLWVRQFRWNWCCPECGRGHLRKRRQNGRNACVNPAHERGVRLVDTPNPQFEATSVSRVGKQAPVGTGRARGDGVKR